jgi:hypothetical protein
MKPPDRRTLGACRANGTAATTRTSHAATTGQRCRAHHRPSRSKRFDGREVIGSTIVRVCYDGAAVTIFTLWFENFPNNLPALFISLSVAVVFVFIFLKAAMSADGRSKFVRRITGPNGKWFFGMLFILWAVVFGVGLQLVPHAGANSPYGGLGLIALFTGFFISMGFLWSVIGE